ncbi:hypothetical protein D0962_14180 [Leptolyngbyaceae cyanobacterium CCMR0082]|uniref:Uncharacterized protein n=2 Tax=Adonisia turfae TaxID=2950184 RepID=A0A6M0S6D9_9CYAN|nr:hypothetical protein [Adonisia turfae]MDV3350144.1 hypothetical protein [Leptothoe sp. LEGE 181152]NEZ59567.1 hypothetical protein [Adonisia turfae CCMR0081]NEZ63920.1 hypothetical protein [Adonisia turfae CCMR0082]
MELNKDIMKAVETLKYRVTVGDVAAKTGLNISQAEAGVLALASETQAHMQVSETGDIAYEFSPQFRAILRNQYWQLRWQETWEKIWAVLFYLIRISFGLMLILAVVLVFAAIIAIQISMQSQREDDNRGGSYSGGIGFNPWLWIGRDWFYWFSYGPRRQYGRQYDYSSRDRNRQGSELNFLEGVYSFLFGDGDPNKDLDERRWGAIATVIRNNRGAVSAEQLAPYLENANLDDDLEDYVIPALSRFNGRPNVSPQGDLVYYFPELQVTAKNQKPQSVPAFLKEAKRRFTSASSNQVAIAIGLGTLLVVGSIYLSFIAADFTDGGFVDLVYSLCDLFLAYGVAFLGIPAIRYFRMQRQNQKIEDRNTQRKNLVGRTVQRKLDYAKQFAMETIVSKDNLAYTTETDLIDQEIENRDKIDDEWRRRLESS